MKTLYITLLFSILSFSLLKAQSFDWAKRTGNTAYEWGYDVVVDSGGYVYTGGVFNDTVDFDPGSGFYNLTGGGGFIQKLDARGHFKWAIKLGGSVKSLSLDEFNNIYVLGKFSGTFDFDPDTGVYNLTSVGGLDVFILKITSEGNLVWAKRIGGAQNERANKILYHSGYVVSLGAFKDSMDLDPGNGVEMQYSDGGYDMFVQKLDSAGTYLMGGNYGGSGDELFYSIAIAPSGDAYFTGSYSDTVYFGPQLGDKLISSGGTDAFILKVDSLGNYLGALSYGGILNDYGSNVIIDDSNNGYFTGVIRDTAIFQFANTTQTYISKGQTDIVVIKVDSGGNLKWMNEYGGNGEDYIMSIKMDKNKSLYIAGSFQDTVDFDPNNGNNLISAGGYDMYTLCLTDSGGFNWVNHTGGTGDDEIYGLYVDNSLNIYSTGYFSSTVDFDPTSGVENLVSAGAYDIFIRKLSQYSAGFFASQYTFTSPPFTVSLTDTSKGYICRNWNLGDGNFGSQSQLSHTYQYNGDYDVMLLLTDSISQRIDTVQKTISCSGGPNNPCSFTSELTQSQLSAMICVGDSFRLSATPNPNVTYAWTHNGAVISGATDSVFYAKQPGFYMAVLSSSSCSKTTSNYFVLANYPSYTPTISVVGTIAPCSNDSVQLNASSGFSSYLWNNGKTAQSIYENTSGRYMVTAIDNDGCKNQSEEVVINVSLADIPKICAVTVNGNSNNNVVRWLAPNTLKIDSFRVYRESSISNQYDYIGGVAYGNPYELVDVNSNIAKRQYAYRITAIDTCGKETPLSTMHKTMHLMINEAINNHWNLYWNPYIGFDYGTYNIYRGTDSLNMNLLATVPSSVNSYSDLNNPSGDIYYQIEVISSNPCSTKSSGTSRSNNFNTKYASGLGFHGFVENDLKVSLYPNPNKGDFTLEIKSQSMRNHLYLLKIYSVFGQIIYQEEINFGQSLQKKMHLGDLSKGLYFVNLQSDESSLKAKFIIE